MPENFQNRRKFVRVYRNFICSYWLKGKEETKIEISQINNISQGGLNFSSTFAFDQGVLLEIELKTPFISEKVNLEGIVLESREKISNLIFEVRLEFQNVSEQAKDVLEKIERYSAQQE